MRDRGAAVVQVNHPRNADGTDFQSFFDRAALVVDPSAQKLGSDPLLSPVSNQLLRLPEGEALFDTGFDAVEILNGFNFRDQDGDGRLDEVRAALTLRDWLGFLSLGFRPAMVGVSDSHNAIHGLQGYPRTYVLATGKDGEAVAAALKQGRAIASNGPLLTVTAAGKSAGGIGDLVATEDDGSVTLTITSQAQTPAQIDRFEVFVNTWVKTAPGLAMPLAATHTLDVQAQPVTRANGGVAYVATAVLPLTVAKDAFVVVRATGNEQLAPFLVDTGPATALAYANPIFLDRNGDGGFSPPARP
jgi:hypothetical protein